MASFSTQFDQHDPFAVAVSGVNQDWARRAADEAVTILQGCTPQEMASWARALETQFQEIGRPAQKGNAELTVARFRWESTDLTLVEYVDLERLRAEVTPLDAAIDVEPEFRKWHPSASDRQVQRWHLYAVLALWKLIDAAEVQRRAADTAAPISLGAASLYSAAKLPRWLDRATALELSNTLVREASMAVLAASAALRDAYAETDELWVLEEARRKKGQDSSKGGRATHARSDRARDKLRGWLAPLVVNFKSRKNAAETLHEALSNDGFDFSLDTVVGWLEKVELEQPELVRWIIAPERPGKITIFELPLVQQDWASSIQSLQTN